jgi:hypothetical protein
VQPSQQDKAPEEVKVDVKPVEAETNQKEPVEEVKEKPIELVVEEPK